MREEIIIMSAMIVLSGFIALELGFTTAIAELLAGMIAKRFIFFEDIMIIEVLANLGILTLMYVAGLEIDLDQLQKRFVPSFVIGFFSFIFPFFVIFGFVSSVMHMTTEQSLLIAIVLSTTAISIVYPILKQTGAMTEDKRMILSAAMITEILSMSALGIFFTESPLLIVLLILGLLIFAKIFPYLGSRIFKYYKGNVAEFEFKIILLLILAVAVVSERAGFESAIIAFLIGMVTSEIVVQHENLEIKLRGIVFGFFAPIFFFWVGLKIGFESIIGSIGFLFLFLTLSFTTKYIGTYLASRLFIPQRADYIASLFNSNLTIGIIIAVFGYESGILVDSGIYSALLGAVILSSVLSAILCRAKLEIY
jgi:glutathione-regulated potassium-efflux system ancillary protein KefC